MSDPQQDKSSKEASSSGETVHDDSEHVSEKTGKSDYRLWWRRNKERLALVSLIILFALVLLFDRIVISIYPGQVGVQWSRFFGTIERNYGEGLHLIFPWNKMYIYETRLQEIHDNVHLLSSDGLMIEVDISSRFRPIKGEVYLLHINVGPDYIERVVRPELVSALRTTLGNFTPQEIYAMDEEKLLDDIYNLARKRIEPTHLELHDLLMLQLILPEYLQEEINKKHAKEQIALAYEHVLEAERQEAIRRKIQAEGLKQFEAIAGIPILMWRGIEATETLARSDNAKFVVIGSDEKGLPVILNLDESEPLMGKPEQQENATREDGASQ